VARSRSRLQPPPDASVQLVLGESRRNPAAILYRDSSKRERAAEALEADRGDAMSWRAGGGGAGGATAIDLTPRTWGPLRSICAPARARFRPAGGIVTPSSASSGGHPARLQQSVAVRPLLRQVSATTGGRCRRSRTLCPKSPGREHLLLLHLLDRLAEASPFLAAGDDTRPVCRGSRSRRRSQVRVRDDFPPRPGIWPRITSTTRINLMTLPPLARSTNGNMWRSKYVSLHALLRVNRSRCRRRCVRCRDGWGIPLRSPDESPCST